MDIGITIQLRHPDAPGDLMTFCARATADGKWRVFVDGGLLANAEEERLHETLAEAMDDLHGEVDAALEWAEMEPLFPNVPTNNSESQ